MNILSAEEIRNWDQFTILNEPISSIDLMERAASRVTDWLMENFPQRSYTIFCGKGNNGGDGLAVARMILEEDIDAKVKVFILEFGAKGTEDFQLNLSRLHQNAGADIHFIQNESNLHKVEPTEIIIDALFGSGLNRGLEGLTARIVQHINDSGVPVISVDIPSGLFADSSTGGMITVKATHTLSFECYKPAFLFAENEEAIGKLHILEIGLLPSYLSIVHPKYKFITRELVRSFHKSRKQFSHKGKFGHALLLAGSYGKMGAAVLSAKACIRSGAGLLTMQIPFSGCEIMQSTVPEAMVYPSKEEDFISKVEEKDLLKYQSIGIGPGIGTSEPAKEALSSILETYQGPIVIDADGLNILAKHQELIHRIPSKSILTPHPKEFERMFGIADNDFARADLAIQKATELNCVIILKGHFSLVAIPSGMGILAGSYINCTGNPGMAKGGSGDILTGLLTGMLAQAYSPAEASIMGVYLHGLAGDIAAEKYSMEAMSSSDIIENLGEAFNATF